MERPQAVLKKLGLSESEITVFLALTKGGALTVRELLKATRMKRPTAYYALRQLEERGLAHATGSQGAERFQAEDPRHLISLLELRKQELDSLEAEVQSILPALERGKPAPGAMPGVSFYEGVTAVKQVIMDTLYCRDRHIDALTPSDNFFWQVGQDFSAKYIEARVAGGITTRNLWERPLKPDIMTRAYKGLSQVRILPVVMHGQFRETVFLYDDCVLSIASMDSAYALLVKSSEHHAMMKAVYDGLWGSSTPIGKERGL